MKSIGKTKEIKKYSAFTLVECLVALFALSFIFLLLLPVIQTNQRMEQKSYDKTQIEWHLFLEQLEYEMQSAEVLRVEKNQLVFKKHPKGGTVLIEMYNDLIRKKQSGGYEPLLTNVATVYFEMVEDDIRLEVVFNNREVYEARLAYDSNG